MRVLTSKLLSAGLCAMMTTLMIMVPTTSFAKSRTKHSAKSGRSAKVGGNSKKSSKSTKSKEDRTPAAAIPEEETVDLAAIADIINSYSTIGEVTANMEAIGFATAEERSAIESFLKDRGVRMETPLERVKYDKNTLRWSEITLTAMPDGNLKNSFGQILKSEGKNLDTAFGEAYLSFDRRTARARAMDLFLQEAQAAETGATPAARAWGALTASIYSGLRAAKSTGKAVAGGLGIMAGVPSEFVLTFVRNHFTRGKLYCGPKGEFFLHPGYEYFNTGRTYHRYYENAEFKRDPNKESAFGKDFDVDADAALRTGGAASWAALKSLGNFFILPPAKNGDVTLAPELVKKYFGSKPVAKCNDYNRVELQAVVRASGKTADEKIKNAQLGKGYGPGMDRNLDAEIAARAAAGASKGAR